MLLVHDVVEIDAGDTFAFDVGAHHDKAAREAAAADRIFALLPPDLETELRALWDEFEAGETREAQFANALDRLSGLLQNRGGGDGGTWQQTRRNPRRRAPAHATDPRRAHRPSGRSSCRRLKRPPQPASSGPKRSSRQAPDRFEMRDHTVPRFISSSR